MGAALSQRWMQAAPEQAGTLYVDGHVRVYHGDQTELPRHYVARQRLCLRASTDYWVNAMDGQPFFVVKCQFFLLRQKGVRSDLGSISCIAAGIVDDRPMIVTGHGEIGLSGGVVRRWDAISGDPIGEPLKGRHRFFPVSSVAIGLVEGRPMIVSGSLYGTVEQWDALSGTCVFGEVTQAKWRWVPAWHDPTGDLTTREAIRTVAIGLVEEQPVIVTGGEDGLLACWHAVSHELIGSREAGSGPLCSVAVGVVEGRPIIVSGGWFGTVLCCDAVSGRPVGAWYATPGLRHRVIGGQVASTRICSITIAAVEGRPLIVSGASDGTLMLRDSWTGEALSTHVFVDFEVRGVAMLPDDRLAVAGEAGLVVG